MYYAGQPYNLRFLVWKLFRDQTKFCSELVASVYRDRQIVPFSSRRSTSVLPADLEALSSNVQWTTFDEEFSTYTEEGAAAGAFLHEDSRRDDLVNIFRSLTDSAIRGGKLKEHSVRAELLLYETNNSGRLNTYSRARLDTVICEADKALRELKSARPLARGAPWMTDPGDERRIPQLIKRLTRTLKTARRRSRP
jgi:hypothetical protein